MDVGHNRNQTAARAQFGDDVLQIGRVLDGGRGDADELAADVYEVERLLNARGRVHRIAGEHRLHNHTMTSADNHAAVFRIPYHHLTSDAPAMEERRLAITLTCWP